MFSHYDPRSVSAYHEEYVRRHVRVPDPLDRSAHGLRSAIGQGLIHLGERLARRDRPRALDRAA